MACVIHMWILFVSLLFGVFNEGVPVDETLITTDMDTSNSRIDPSSRSLYENTELPDSRDRFNMGILAENDIKEVDGIPAAAVNILSLLRGDTRYEYSNGDVNMEKSNVLSPKLWRSSSLKQEQLSKPAIGNNDAAEIDPISKDSNYIRRTFKEVNDMEMVDNTVSYDNIVHIGPSNYKMEPAKVNNLHTRHERGTDTTESSKEDFLDVDVDSSSLIDNMNTIGLNENNVPDIGRQIFANKVVFRVQLQMEYDTDSIPPDIKTDGILENLNFKQSPAERVESKTHKEASVSVSFPENLTKIMSQVLNSDNDTKYFQGKQTTPYNRQSRSQKSRYNRNKNVELQSTVENSTEYAIYSRDTHTEDISSDVNTATNTENSQAETPKMAGKSKAIKISLRSNFADDYPSISIENDTDVSAVTTDEVNINDSSIMDLVHQHDSFLSTGSRDITVEDSPELGDAEAVMEKRMERFMFMEMGLGVVIIISCVTTVIQITVLVKKWKGSRNTYDCTAAVP